MTKGVQGAGKALSLLFSTLLSLQLFALGAPRALADSYGGMPSGEEILAGQDEITINASWQDPLPIFGWVPIAGYYGHYIIRVVKNEASGPQPIREYQKSFYDNQFDLSDVLNEYGLGTYAIQVDAFDKEGIDFAHADSDPRTFHKLSLEINAIDEQGNPSPSLNGGNVKLDLGNMSDGSDTTRDLYYSECNFLLSATPNDGFVLMELKVDGQIVENGYGLSMNDDHTVTATFRQDSSRVPATITLDDGHEDVAQAIAAALNEDDSLCDATATDDVVSFTVLKAQTRNNAIAGVQQVLVKEDIIKEDIIDQWNLKRLLAPRRDYANISEWYADMRNLGGDDVPMGDTLSLFLVWVQTISEVNVSVKSPTCGTSVSTISGEEGRYTQSNGPDVTVDGNAFCDAAYWMASGSLEPTMDFFEGTIQGGCEYTAQISLDARFGYELANDAQIKVNGKDATVLSSSQHIVAARIKAVHDWDDATSPVRCTSCQCERVTVSFDKGDEEATGSMEAASCGTGESFTLPDCGFTAPAQKEFDHWLVQVEGADPVAREPGDTFTATGDVIATAVFETPSTEPEFKTYALTLTGQIGLNVFMKLPETEGVSYENSYMEFEVTGKRGRTVKVSLDSGFRDKNTGRYYGFTLPLTSIEMAQNVNATFHYTSNGADVTVTRDGLSVEKYINGWIGTGITGTDLRLAQALADYGYHVQQYLSRSNGWSLGGDYTAMNTVFNSAYDRDSVLQELNTNNANASVNFSQSQESPLISKVHVQLVLDSETTLNIWLTPTSGVELGEVTMMRPDISYQSYTYTPERVGDRYLIRVTGIQAQDLNGPIIVYYYSTDESNSFFELSLSPLCYAKCVLGDDSFASDHGHEAMCALYNYHTATVAYRADH